MPAGIAAQYLHEDVAGGVAQLPQFRSKPSRRFQISASPMIPNLAPQCEQQRAWPVQRRRELPCPRVHLSQLRCAPAPARDESPTERDLQIELSFLTPIAVGH